MAYSRDRLEKALKLFNNAESELNGRGFSTSYLGSYLNSQYDLRDKPRQSGNGITTWIDNDESGDYTPKGKSSRKRKQPTQGSDNDDSPRSGTKKPKSNPPPRPEGDEGLNVTPKLDSPPGRELLANLSRDGSPAANHLQNGADSDSSTSWPTLPQPKKPKTPQKPTSTHSLRSRGVSSGGTVAATSEVSGQGGLSLLSTQNTNGKGGARSTLIQRLQSSRQEPAALQPTTSPLAASSIDVPFQGRPQTPLASDSPSRRASSGTPTPSTRRRPAPSRSKNNTPTASTPNGLQRNSANPFAVANSSRSVKNHIGGNPEPVRAGGLSIKQPRKGLKLLPTKMEERSITNDANHTEGVSKVITTFFAHPMTFSHTPPVDGSKPCHWCHDFTYGILGLGKVEVEVIDYRNREGYVEVQGGHFGRGREPSRMCSICALDRIHVGNCGPHDISALENVNELSFDFGKAFKSLDPKSRADTDTGSRIKSNHWCSLCPNPAFYGCSTIQKFNKFREPLTPGSADAKGCGLLLCRGCAETMKKSNFSLPLTVMEHKRVSRELRADVEFLLPQNDLFMSYRGGN